MKKNITFLILFAGLFMTGLKSSAQGNGSEGPLNLTSGTLIINTVVSAVSGANAAGTTLNVASSGGFTVGDMVLIIQMYGTNAGLYDELPIASMTATSLTFSSPTSIPYTSASTHRAQVIRIPQYSTIAISPGAILTAPAWNGNTGGVLTYYANNTVTINGTVTMDGKGFTGGTGGTGNAAGASGATAGSRGTTSGDDGTNASPAGGGAGGNSFGGSGGNGGQGNTATTATAGTAGNGIGGGSPGVGGANMSSGIGTLVMGGGGGGGQGGSGGQYGGSGGGGGASSLVLLGSGRGSNGTNGTAGTASTAVGGAGGTGGGIVLIRVISIAGNGAITSKGSNGTNGTGAGGNGGNGGNGGSGGELLSGIILSNGGGGGGGGIGGQGGQGSGGGGGGGAGVIAITTRTGTPSWTGIMSNAEGAPGIGGAGGTSGTSGIGGVAGRGWLLGTDGQVGSNGGAVAPGLAGPTATLNAFSNPPVFLPVNLINFTGKVSGTEILLQWSTTSENNSYYIIEKSANGEQFQTLSKIDGRGNAESINYYELTDATPFAGNNYYRLTEVDANGETTLLKVIVVSYPANVSSEVSMNVYPNPVGDDKTIYILAEGVGASAEIKLYNLLGEVVFSRNGDFQTSQNTIVLPQSLGTGIYTLELIGAISQVQKTEKIILR